MLYVVNSLIKRIEAEMRNQIEEPMTPNYLEVNKLLEKNWIYLNDIKKEIESKGESKYSDMHHDCRLSPEEIKCWNENMITKCVDGSEMMGGFWSEEKTTELAASLGVCFEHFTAAEWNVTCNMIHSDYSAVAKMSGLDTPKFYGEMAKAFLIDADGGKPCEKLCRYYRHIVKY